ncbi:MULTISPECIES: D-alanyl-D-alanine carboxypeptidase family protein [Pelosinus]|uniref:serine-type D-Ala-D-Ala carboxypeptidase n=1 Tax=Pelosinus fermentans B4 TaxID=1149862 RepID=I8RFY2_9FIRM|nr:MULTISPECIES: D-alanyl-D-alanine carboxypeptidase family protein [Pelosinus]EIW18478.1 peptidase S11 D-alanyl-D-alanine carboxypeptidase 1 [Pelosinus fermentans B4]EIW24492.1 peptidase S11 D-alanyl-D-alanine carboxypeptidase 1 [Pelosinus fermentans A11]OAM94450.1 Serine-type D-Ala-D-Ala carboxypeptidase [Pelosinus fermentans DSM 17108]SDR09447.1 D-alanyl-D-alanine carboxypeptidase (penicillin-binding protein 5/6) [Pelosinus fermentans]
MIKKKKIRISIVVLMLFMTTSTVFAAANYPNVTAKSAIVMDAATGKVIYSKAAKERRYPASTTKMMSLIVALEHGNLDDVITASPNAASTEGSSLWLTQGEQMTMTDLLYGIMLISGNDATVAVAEHISGSVQKFAELMTEKAHAIGARDTNFTNSSGLPDPNHYTTAHDLAKIAAYGYKNPLFTQIVSTEHKILPPTVKGDIRDLYNENKMLWFYEGGNGVKTGYTDAAGRCLVSGAKRDNIQLIAVVLDSDTMWDDSKTLLDFAFSQLKPETVFNQGDILKTTRVANGKSELLKLVANTSIILPVSETDKDEFSTVIDAPMILEAPITKGQKLGVARVFYNNTEVAAVDLVADESVERKSFFSTLVASAWNIVTLFLKNFA